jgi:hypothetical protein
MLRKKSILIGLFVALLTFQSFASGGWLVYRPALRSIKPSEDLSSVVKEPVTDDLGIDLITDIKIQDKAKNNWQIACAGLRGVAYLNNQNQLASTVKFSGRASEVKFIDRPDHKDGWYYDRGGHGWANSALLDLQGNLLWSYGKGLHGIDSMIGGYLDNSGQIKFVVGLNGDGGVRMLDQNGKEIWHQPGGNVWQVELFDADNNGGKQIIHTDIDTGFTIRETQQGNMLRNFKCPDVKCNTAHFNLLHWPSKKDPLHILVMNEQALYVLDFNGNVKAQLAAPGAAYLGRTKSLTFKLHPDEPEYLAVIGNFESMNRSFLYIYNVNGNLIYQEEIEGEVGAIEPAPIGNHNVEGLLISINSKLWFYHSGNLKTLSLNNAN